MQILLELKHLRTVALVDDMHFHASRLDYSPDLNEVFPQRGEMIYNDSENYEHWRDIKLVLDQLRRTCNVTGSAQPIGAREMTPQFERIRAPGAPCNCWDPCGYRMQAACKNDDGVYSPSMMKAQLSTPCDDDRRPEMDASVQNQLVHNTQYADRAPASVTHTSLASIDSETCFTDQGAVELPLVMAPLRPYMHGLRRLLLHVRKVNFYGDELFWRAVAKLPHLEELEVDGHDAAVGVYEFLEMLAGHSVLRSLCLDGRGRRMRGMGRVSSALKLLPALREAILTVHTGSLYNIGLVSEILAGDQRHEKWHMNVVGATPESVRALIKDNATFRAVLLDAQQALDAAWKGAMSEMFPEHPQMERLKVCVRGPLLWQPCEMIDPLLHET